MEIKKMTLDERVEDLFLKCRREDIIEKAIIRIHEAIMVVNNER